MVKEFKEFIARGNVLDLAIGVIIGAAFGAIIDSFVKDIVNPVIGLFGKANFQNMFLVLKEGSTPGPYTTPAVAQQAGAVTLNYGAFINNVITFLIVAAAVFMIIRAANRLYQRPAEPTSDTKPCPFCTMTVARAATRCPNCTSQLAAMTA